MDSKLKLKCSLGLIALRILLFSMSILSFALVLIGMFGVEENTSITSDETDTLLMTESNSTEEELEDNFLGSTEFYTCIEAVKYVYSNQDIYNCEKVTKISFFQSKEKHVLIEYINKSGNEKKIAYNATDKKGYVDASDYYTAYQSFKNMTGENEVIYDIEDRELALILREASYGVN